MTLKTLINKIKWFLQERCTDCGGEIHVWSAKKAWCKDCEKRH